MDNTSDEKEISIAVERFLKLPPVHQREILALIEVCLLEQESSSDEQNQDSLTCS